MFESQKTETGSDAKRILLFITAGGALVAFATLIFVYFGAIEHFYYYVLAFIIAIVVVRQFMRADQRTIDVQQFAKTLPFTYLGGTLPTTFPLQKTESLRDGSIWQVYASQSSEKEILFFDWQLGHGRVRFSRTVVALRGSRADFGGARFGQDFITEEVDGWTLVYGERRLLEAGEIAMLVLEALEPQARDQPTKE